MLLRGSRLHLHIAYAPRAACRVQIPSLFRPCRLCHPQPGPWRRMERAPLAPQLQARSHPERAPLAPQLQARSKLERTPLAPQLQARSQLAPSPKPTVPVDFTPPKKVFTHEDQLALKADGQSILPDRPVDWTTELESDMWEEYGKFKLEQQKRARFPAHEVAEEASKKAPRAQGSDGRPVIFARRYLPTTSKGKLLSESLVVSCLLARKQSRKNLSRTWWHGFRSLCLASLNLHGDLILLRLHSGRLARPSAMRLLRRTCQEWLAKQPGSTSSGTCEVVPGEALVPVPVLCYLDTAWSYP